MLYLMIVSELSPEGTLVECEPYPIVSPLFEDWDEVADYIATHADEVLYENEGTAYHLGNDMYWVSRQEEYLMLNGYRIDL